MNSIKKLKENIASFLTEIAAHYGIPKSEVVATLREINFYCQIEVSRRILVSMKIL